MAITKDERLALVFSEALEEFNNTETSLREVREECLQDRRFVSVPGAMWEGPLSKQFANKPRFEVNKVMKSLIKIYNDYRNNRITVDFTNKDGTGKDDLASMCDGLFRADSQDSNAEEATDNAFEEAVAGGYGAWRLRAEYEDEYDDDNDHQRIRFEPIYDADSCVFFVGGKKQDASDSKACFVLSSSTVQEFIDEWDEDPESWPKGIDQSYFDWYRKDVVYTAEYYKVEEKVEVIHIYKDVMGEEYKYSSTEIAEEEFVNDLLARGIIFDRKKRVKARRIHKYIMSGGGVLEDCGYIAGKNIPIIPVYGKRWFIDNIERCCGHVRLAKDPSRIKNMQISKLAELAAISATEKPIFTPEQMLGHQELWAEDNITNNPYLLVNPVTDANGQEMAAGPVAYTKVPNIPPAMIGLIQATEQDLRDILGNDGAEQLVSNISGEAIERVQNRLDMQTFIYVSNMAKAMKRCGEIWLSMAKELYTEEGRKMKSIASNGDASSVEIRKPYENEDKKTEFRNDLTEASFDVVVDIGPTSDSKREAVTRQLLAMKQFTTDQETIQVIDALLMMNMDGEGIEDTKTFWRRKLLAMGAVEPTQEEQEEARKTAEATPPDPNAVFLESEAIKSRALAEKAIADTEKSRADTEKIQAETIEIVVDTEAKSQEAFEKVSSLMDESIGSAGPTSEIEED